MAARTETPYLVYSRRNRYTGTETALLNLAHPDSPFEAESGDRWAAACLEHDVMVTGPDRKGMSKWVGQPHIWCPVCHVDFVKASG